MPCGSRSQPPARMPSGSPSHSAKSARVGLPATRVRMAERRCVLPVEYSIPPPGSSRKGRASAKRTQLRLAIHAPYRGPEVGSSPACIERRLPSVTSARRGSGRSGRSLVSSGATFWSIPLRNPSSMARPTSAETITFEADLMLTGVSSEGPRTRRSSSGSPSFSTISACSCGRSSASAASRSSDAGAETDAATGGGVTDGAALPRQTLA